MSSPFKKPQNPTGSQTGGIAASTLIASMQVFSMACNDSIRTACAIVEKPDVYGAEVVDQARTVIRDALPKLRQLMVLIDMGQSS